MSDEIPRILCAVNLGIVGALVAIALYLRAHRSGLGHFKIFTWHEKETPEIFLARGVPEIRRGRPMGPRHLLGEANGWRLYAQVYYFPPR